MSPIIILSSLFFSLHSRFKLDFPLFVRNICYFVVIRYIVFKKVSVCDRAETSSFNRCAKYTEWKKEYNEYLSEECFDILFVIVWNNRVTLIFLRLKTLLSFKENFVFWKQIYWKKTLVSFSYFFITECILLFFNIFSGNVIL